MRLRDELRDPWGLLLAGTAAGAAAVVGGIPIAAAIGVGAVVFGVKVFAGRIFDHGPGVSQRTLPVRGGTPEARWLQRAERAVRSMRGLASGTRPGPVAERAAFIGDQSQVTLESLRRLAGQTSAVAAALGHVNPDRLLDERDRLATRVRRAGDPHIRQETESALQSVESQLEVHARLAQARAQLLARLESGVLGVESLLARLAEVVTLAETAGATGDTHRIDVLADELEGLRAGLAETEDLSRRALSAYEANRKRG